MSATPVSSKVLLDLRVKVCAEKRATLLSFLERAIPFYEQPGGIRVTLLQNRADPCQMIERVEYANIATFEQDQQRVAHDAQMKCLLEEWRSLLDGPPTVEIYLEQSVACDREPAPSIPFQ